jgi:XTP/dITP diphosphohydrolase
MVDLLIATTNPGKFAEVTAILKPLHVNLISISDLRDPPNVIEDGASFEENAIKKARTFAEYSGFYTLADDSGLEVDALNGAPGIYSARYSGEEGSDGKNNKKLLDTLKHVPEEKRHARFVCALALCAPRARGGKEWIVRDSCEGTIGFAAIGRNGFGYDPLFFFPLLGKTFGEIDRQKKASVSHRGKALKKLAEILPQCLELPQKP